MKWTEDIERKRSMANELYFLIGVAGMPVEKVTYTVDRKRELYTVSMKTGQVYKIDVSADSPMMAAYDFIRYMFKKA